jgi:predicted NAD/FAD-binding protein
VIQTLAQRPSVAIVGSGVSGLVAAHRLHRSCDISIFEAGSYIGGHTHTVDIEQDGQLYPVDTGFIVYNEKNYPHFSQLLDELAVPTQPTQMSFSVQCQQSGLEYNGTSINKIFAQRSNLLSPSFHRMLRDIIRFYRQAPELLQGDDSSTTLGEYLERGRFGDDFVQQHIIPMGAAIWSAAPGGMWDFPARSFAQFFHNHGFLQWKGRPQWRVVKGGSQQYVKALVSPFTDRIHLNSPVQSIRRFNDGVEIEVAGQAPQRFDEVVIAVHSDQALRLLADASQQEREILAGIRYQKNETVLHTDAKLLPKKERAWASWNYFLPEAGASAPTVTYNMNILQGLESKKPFCVSLNRQDEIDEKDVLRRMTYHHPIYDLATLDAQHRRGEINGVNRTYYCGAYWGYGFHEDGARSGIEVAQMLGDRHKERARV